MLQAMPRKGFGSADCVQRDRLLMSNYIVSQADDPNFFRGTAGKSLV